ncbi:hypothetical protein [Bacillus andreraoultii]|uniref:hypothetical protein n=1 Tax=Bacillus andreraoultii TaxID=1499685 RepID=UPI00053B8506|nr:hypothetical protein [Bacillus andreraoultii]
MKVKGTVKSVGKKPNFWGDYEKNIPPKVKEMIYDQYYSLDTMFIYCDCSMQLEKNMMSAACSYLQGGSVTVKSSIIYPPNDCKGKNTYGELQAVMFGLNHFDKHMNRFTKKIVIYSDVKDINRILNRIVTFRKVSSLMKLQTSLILLFEQKQMENPNLNISIEYLSYDIKAYNPFAKSAHNAARKVLKEK